MTTNKTNSLTPSLSPLGRGRGRPKPNFGAGREGCGGKIMGAIVEVHKELGPGFLEFVYEKALLEELLCRGMRVETQKAIDLKYKNNKIGVHRLNR